MNELKPAVLVVEDNPDDVLFLEHALDGRYNIRTVGTLSEAVCVLSQSVPQVILLDLELPDSRFPDTLKAISVVARDAAIVIVSGQGDEAFVQRCIDEGAHGFLPKDQLAFINIVSEITRAVETNIIKQALRALRASKTTQQTKT